MSFILDALKKLEENRHKESAPDITTIHTSGAKQGNRTLLIYILIAVLLLNAMVLAAWLRPRQNDNDPSAVQNKEIGSPPAPAAPERDAAAAKQDAPQVQETAGRSPAPDTVVTYNRQVPAMEAASLPINPSPEEIAALKSRIYDEQLSLTTKPSIEEPIEEETSRSAETTLPDISKLPLSIKNELPELTVKGHIYSNDPMSRLVNINGKVIREGGTVTTVLKVNEITMSGVILDYKGTLFHIKAF